MDRIARAVEPTMSYRHQMPETSRAPRRPPRDVERGHRPRRGARRPRDPRRDRERPHRLGDRPAPLRAARWSASRTIQTAVQQMALEWGVLPLLMPSTRRRRGPLGAHDRDGARGRDHRPRRPRRAHRRHRGQPLRLDERDQGRARRLASISFTGRKDPALGGRSRCRASADTLACPGRDRARRRPLLEADPQLRAHEGGALAARGRGEPPRDAAAAARSSASPRSAPGRSSCARRGGSGSSSRASSSSSSAASPRGGPASATNVPVDGRPRDRRAAARPAAARLPARRRALPVRRCLRSSSRSRSARDGTPFPTQFWLTCSLPRGRDRAARGGRRRRALDEGRRGRPGARREPRACSRRAAGAPPGAAGRDRRRDAARQPEVPPRPRRVRPRPAGLRARRPDPRRGGPALAGTSMLLSMIRCPWTSSSRVISGPKAAGRSSVRATTGRPSPG